MAKLYFRYGTMNSGKSIEVLRVAHNYEEQGKKVLLLTSVMDDRFGVGKVTSRIGMQKGAIVVDEHLDMLALAQRSGRIAFWSMKHSFLIKIKSHS